MASIIGDYIEEVMIGPHTSAGYECSMCESRGAEVDEIEHDGYCIVGEAVALLAKLELAEQENQGLSDACVRLRDKMLDGGAMTHRFTDMMGGPEHVIDAATEYFGRLEKGKVGYMHKLDPEEVAAIVEKYETGNITQVRLAQYYGVSQAAISMIVRKKRRQG